MGLKIRHLGSGGIRKFRKIPFKQFNRTRAIRKLRNNDFVSPAKLVVLTFKNFNNHEPFVKENIIPPYPRNVVKPSTCDMHGSTAKDVLLVFAESTVDFNLSAKPRIGPFEIASWSTSRKPDRKMSTKNKKQARSAEKSNDNYGKLRTEERKNSLEETYNQKYKLFITYRARLCENKGSSASGQLN